MTHRLPSPLLVVEASTSAGSVALIVDDVVVAEREVQMGPSRDDTMLPAIAELVNVAGIAPTEFAGIACGSGPGSFTSLRIAASLAKGIAVAANASLYAVPSLLLAAVELKRTPGVYLLHADALRGERYAARVVVGAGAQLEMSSVNRLTHAQLLAEATKQHAALVAVGVAATSEHDVMTVQPHARNAVLLIEAWSTFGPVSVDSWEPEYGRLAEAQVKWESAHGRALPLTSTDATVPPDAMAPVAASPID